MAEASCHCGAIRLQIAEPEVVTDCNCSICRRYGALWAYYSPTVVGGLPARDETDVYVWGDKSLEFHRCKGCGCVTHWWPLDPSRDRMGINARLLDLDVLRTVRVRRLDAAVTGKYLDD